MPQYVCDCTNLVYMLYVYGIYTYVNKFEARSLFSTSNLNDKHMHACIKSHHEGHCGGGGGCRD